MGFSVCFTEITNKLNINGVTEEILIWVKECI